MCGGGGSPQPHPASCSESDHLMIGCVAEIAASVCAARHLRVGRKMPLPTMKCSFSRLEVGRSSSMLFPSSLWSPSVSRLVT